MKFLSNSNYIVINLIEEIYDELKQFDIEPIENVESIGNFNNLILTFDKSYNMCKLEICENFYMMYVNTNPNIKFYKIPSNIDFNFITKIIFQKFYSNELVKKK